MNYQGKRDAQGRTLFDRVLILAQMDLAPLAISAALSCPIKTVESYISKHRTAGALPPVRVKRTLTEPPLPSVASRREAEGVSDTDLPIHRVAKTRSTTAGAGTKQNDPGADRLLCSANCVSSLRPTPAVDLAPASSTAASFRLPEQERFAAYNRLQKRKGLDPVSLTEYRERSTAAALTWSRRWGNQRSREIGRVELPEHFWLPTTTAA